MEIPEILERVDIAELISQYVELEEKDGEFWALSPFADPPEKTPSFSVRRETGKFFCFSTGIGGTAITFLKYYYKISSHEAIEMLKKYIGCDGEDTAYHKRLAATKVCQKYSRPRQMQKTSKATILPDDYMERYEKRDDKLAVWEAEGISKASLERFQVRYDGFSNRLVYPIRNTDGKIVNIGGRTLDPDWKEKKQRKYCYFYSWGTMDTVYGLAENMEYILARKEVIVFEGCKSVLIADSWGLKNCVSLLTSHVNPHQLKIFIKLGCRVVFALDKDVNIRNDHNIQKLKRYVNVEYLSDTSNLLSEKDSPVDRGKEVFKSLYERRLKYR